MKSQVSGSLGKRTIQFARYWTLDQALIWLATDNLAEAAATEPFATYGLCRELKHSYSWTQDEMLRLLRTVEGLANWNGETVPTLWLHKATLVLGTPNHMLLNVPEFAAVLQRRADAPRTQSAEFASFNIEAMAPSIDGERLIVFVADESSAHTEDSFGIVVEPSHTGDDQKPGTKPDMQKTLKLAAKFLRDNNYSQLTRDEAENDILARVHKGTSSVRREAIEMIPKEKRRPDGVLVKRDKELADCRRFLLAAK